MAQNQVVGKHATTVRARANGGGCVTYHDTDVVVWNEHQVLLDTGGWFTVTTKTRMNQAANQFGLGYQVYQEKGQWYVWFPWDDREEIPFGERNWVVFDREISEEGSPEGEEV